MKNKIVQKIILVVVCISILTSVFVISSSAYSFANTSAMNNNVENIRLPHTQMMLENIDSTITDVPGYLYIPTCDYYGRGERTVCSVNSNINNNDVNFALIKNVTGSNVYTTNGYVQEADVKIKCLDAGLDFSFYRFSGIRAEDWGLGANNVPTNSIYDSFTFTLSNDSTVRWFYNQNPSAPDYVPYIPVKYVYSYIDFNGKSWTQTLYDKIILEPDNMGDMTQDVTVRYFPDKFYYTDVIESNPSFNDFWNVYEVFDLSNIYFLDYVAIHLNFVDDVDIRMMEDSSETNISRSGHYINRISTASTIAESVSEVIPNSYDFGYDLGVLAGREEGYEEGRAVGYQEGLAEADISPFDMIINSVNNLLNWEFIPGISFSVLFSIIIGISLLVLFLKIFAGG